MSVKVIASDCDDREICIGFCVMCPFLLLVAVFELVLRVFRCLGLSEKVKMFRDADNLVPRGDVDVLAEYYRTGKSL